MSGPTLSKIGMLTFHDNAIVPDMYANMMTNTTSIDIIISILKNKMNRSGLNNKFFIVKGRTGSGKSTYMVQNIFSKILTPAPDMDAGGITVCEPRIVLTRSNANDIMRYDPKLEYGKNMGILTSSDRIKTTEKRNVTFCTTQTLNNILNQFLLEPDEEKIVRMMLRYKFIMIDEVHVLNIQTISLLKTLKNFLNRFSELREMPVIIFASATLNEKKLFNYYFGGIDEVSKDYSTFVEITGLPNYPVTERYLNSQILEKINTQERDNAGNRFYPWGLIGDYFYKRIFESLFESKSEVTVKYSNVRTETFQVRDALIFAPAAIGMEAISSKIKYLIKRDFEIINGKDVREPIVKKIKSIIDSEDQVIFINRGFRIRDLEEFRHKFANKKRILLVGFGTDYSEASDLLVNTAITQIDRECLVNETKIFISTNAIEAAKTISTLYFCVDVGIDSKAIYNPLKHKPGTNILKRVPENINQKIQRKGRVGRESPGIFLNFFSREVEDELTLEDISETVNNYILSTVVMDSIMNKNNYYKLDVINMNDFYEKISIDILIKSANDLILSGLINSFGEHNPKLNDDAFSGKPWLIYAKILYYIYNFKLIDALMFASSNRYEIGNNYNLFHVNPKDITTKMGSRLVEFIGDARASYTKILYKQFN